MKNIIPEKIRITPKRHVVTPQHEWLRKNLRSNVEDLINDKKFKERGYFDHKEVISTYKKFCKNDFQNSFPIWQWINTEMWFRKFID